MNWGGAHFIIKSVHRPKPYYDSIKYKIINNNPYNLICVVYSIKDQNCTMILVVL